MGKLKIIETNVYAILIKYPESRANDFVLYAMYLKEHNAELKDAGLIYALMKSKELGMPNYESITRARRKLQQHNPKLRPPAKTEIERAKKENQFRSYAYTSSGKERKKA